MDVKEWIIPPLLIAISLAKATLVQWAKRSSRVEDQTRDKVFTFARPFQKF